MDHSSDANDRVYRRSDMETNDSSESLQQQEYLHQNESSTVAQHQLLEPTVYLVPLSSRRNGEDHDRQRARLRTEEQHRTHRFDDRIPSNAPSVDQFASSNDSSSGDGGARFDRRPLTPQSSHFSVPTDEEDADRVETAREKHHERPDNGSQSNFFTSTFPQPQRDGMRMAGCTAANPIVLHDATPSVILNASSASHDVGASNSWNRNATRSGSLLQNPSIASATTSINNNHAKLGGTTLDEDTTGGRLWKMAGEVAAGKVSLLGHDPRNGPVRQIKETFLERMRSRADPDALCVAIAPTVYSPLPQTPHMYPSRNSRMVKMPIVLVSSSLSHPPSVDEYREDEAFLINTGLAHKRVRVVQLMIIGLFGILLPWMGNLFVSSSCYFASVSAVIGSNGDVFPLHFGLWNYTPVSSVLDGSNYCYPYYHSTNDDSYSSMQYPFSAPILSRMFNLAALFAGTFSLVVLWYYLISSRVRHPWWNAAVYAALGAGIFQFATPLFFLGGRMCRSNSCAVGPGMALSIVTALAWCIFAAELYHHCPISKNKNSNASASTNNVPALNDNMPRSQNAPSAAKSYFTDREHQVVTPRFSQLEMSSFTCSGFDPQHSRQYDPPELT
jgi:hypothetical protein